MLTFTETTPLTDEAATLIRELDADLLQRYPREHVHGLHDTETAHFQGVFLVARLAGEPVGCGALRLLGSGVGEVKRMYVRPAARGQGIARRLLAALEEAGRRLGLTVLRLETGTLQHEAISLYESMGYARIASFGAYVGRPFSVCFEKQLYGNEEFGD